MAHSRKENISALENRVQALLEKDGVEYIKHPTVNVLVGKSWRRLQPDFLVPSMRLAIEVNGCYVHGCPECYGGPGPQTRRLLKYDRRVRALERANFRVLTFWEHELSSKNHEVTSFVNDS